MDRTPLPDLDSLDREALLDLICAHEQQQSSLVASYDEEIRRLEAELDAQRQALSEQAEELDSRSARIENLKLMVEKFRRMRTFSARTRWGAKRRGRSTPPSLHLQTKKGGPQ